MKGLHIRATCLLGVIISVTQGQDDSWTAGINADLLKHLTSNKSYHTFVRPTYTSDVTIEFGIASLRNMDIVSQQMIVVGFLILAWRDKRLAWQPQLYGNITSTYVKTSDIWVPPIVLHNAADKLEVLTDDKSIASIPIRVQSSGVVIWLAPVTFVAACDVNIHNFPFDSQTCSVLVSSWMFSSSELQLHNGAKNINLELYQDNGEWCLVGSKSSDISRIIHHNAMSALKFEMMFKRKYGYYVINMILPIVIVSFLGSLVFLLPVQSDEKIGFSLTIFLIVSVVLMIISDSIPSTSTHVSLLSVYLLITFLVCSFELLITVLTVRYFHQHNMAYQLPVKLQKFMTNILVPITRYRKPSDETGNVETNSDDTKQLLMEQISVIHLGKELENKKTFQLQTSLPQNARNSVSQGEAYHLKNSSLYTYQDFATVLDKLDFVVFFSVTCIVTTFFVLLSVFGV